MTDKELAEKVENRLDLKSKGGIGVMDWQAFGLMVKDAEKRGWEIHQGGYTRFREITRVRVGKKQDGFKTVRIAETTPFSIKEHGHIKACALAYLEIPNDQ